jgi:Spy/CpxP family protein refolding chaperone
VLFLSKYKKRNFSKRGETMKRIFTAVLLTLTLTAGVFAQGRGGPPRDPTATLTAALGLTDAQVTAFKALIATEKTRAQAIQTEISTNRKALEALLTATAPNPTDVGNAAITAHTSEMKMAAERTWFITQFKALLTGAQQTTLDSLLAAGTPIPGLGGPGFGGPGFGPGPRGAMRGGPRP